MSDQLKRLQRIDKRIRGIKELEMRLKAEREASSRELGASLSDLPLQQFVPAVTKTYGESDIPPMEPAHLGDLTDAFERAVEGEPVRACMSYPPQHGKTETVLHGLAWALIRHPDWRILYTSAGTMMATRQRSRLVQILTDAGARIYRSTADQIDIELPDGSRGGCIKMVGFRGQILGEKFNLIVCDDVHKGVMEASSPVLSDQVHRIFDTTIMSRQVPGQTGVIVIHQRLARTDLIGYLERKGGWNIINRPMLDEMNKPLWPERYSVQDCLERKAAVGQWTWETMYMGAPTHQGATVFSEGGIRVVKELPDPSLCRRAYGIDLAYSLRDSADFSTIVEVWAKDDQYYIVDAWRGRVSEADFITELRRRHSVRRGPIFFWGNGQERAHAKRISENSGLPIRFKLAVNGKYANSREAAVAWNAGRIHIPEEPKFRSDDLVEELLSFTGVRGADVHDDLVDSFTSAFLGLSGPRVRSTRDIMQNGSLRPRYRWSRA